ncbi:glycosyltransferase family 4 protein [Piscinibacter sp. XHJ-5]|uniref:glycosyltransferase family 4 protein n=1 Tax=Piscinibacter sp. XHJ-5 TaxID=3037797 RepID=UPI002452B262|nr:glycosyltransferase family 4 protein [Piscinibacter sp. XHJ-5]
MRIAQIAPLLLPVPPGRYGGTERVIYDLTEGLVARGHEVTLFASGDSRTSARLVPAVPRALWQDSAADPLAADFLLHAQVFRRAAEFDLIHGHTGYRAFPYIAHAPAKVVTTQHGRLDVPSLQEIFRLFPEALQVSISRDQQAHAPQASWADTIHHGLALQNYPFDAQGGDELFFVSRLCRDKAPHEAIDIAVDAGMRLTLAGRIDPIDRGFFEREVEPRLAHPLVRYAGEVSEDEKLELMRHARALLFPIDWPEPFGLVMIEAMACGTPVVARPKGAAPEVIVDGETGFLADSHEALVEAVKATHRIDRAACRRHVETHFTVDTMVDRYEALYRRLV